MNRLTAWLAASTVLVLAIGCSTDGSGSVGTDPQRQLDEGAQSQVTQSAAVLGSNAVATEAETGAFPANAAALVGGYTMPPGSSVNLYMVASTPEPSLTFCIVATGGAWALWDSSSSAVVASDDSGATCQA